MKWLASRVLWGILLIAAGIIFLLDNLGVLAIGELLWIVIFTIAGAGFLSVYIQDRRHWWAFIPGLTLLSVAVTILLGFILPTGSDEWIGGIVPFGIGLSFLLIYLNDREQWWAIIPMGVMFTVAFMVLLESLPRLGQQARGFEMGGLFFLGMGLTFALVALLPGSATRTREQMRWAWIPAAILLVIGIFILTALTNLINYLWPLALILLGLFLVLRTLGVLK